MIKNSIIKNLLEISQKLLNMVQMPLFPSKFSKKTFTNHQLFILLVLKAYSKKDYRRFVDDLKTSKIIEILKMDRIPHFTTLQKFAQRQSVKNMENMLKKFIKLSSSKTKNTGFDATCFTLTHASKHYEKRIGKPTLKKDFLKANCFYDLDNLMILGVKIRKRSRHDLKDMKALWNKIGHLPFKYVYADKAYDANWFHEMIFESGKISRIHIKREEIPVHRTLGVYRKAIKRHQKNSEKGKRSLCETINSMIKKIFGSVIYARNYLTQRIEVLFRIIAFNCERISNFFCYILFLLKKCLKMDFLLSNYSFSST